MIFGQDNTVNWFTFNSGFGIQESSDALIISSVGQVFIGTMEGNNAQINSGFLVNSSFKNYITSTESKSNHISSPIRYDLSQNYPNPFNPVTTIGYSVSKNSKVGIFIYNVLGQLVKTLVNKNKDAGYYTVNWNGTDKKGKSVGSGVYIYKMETDNFTKTKKLILLK